MIIGIINDQQDVQEVNSKIFAKHTLTNNIATYTFKTLDGEDVRNYRNWYFDLGMVAKHFTVSSHTMPHIMRQYTICQTMDMHILKALFKLAKDILDNPIGSEVMLDESLFHNDDTNQISLTLKNYERTSGVATQIFNVDLTGYQTSLLNSNVLLATVEEEPILKLPFGVLQPHS